MAAPMPDPLLQAIRAAMPGLDARENEPLSAHTSFRIGGPAARMLFPAGAAELEALCALLRRLGERPLLLGNGTNVLAPDRGLDRTVVVTSGAAGMTALPDGAAADCGAALTKLALFAAEKGLGGLEFAYGIPGTVGGALVMNAGAYGGEMKDVAAETELLDEALVKRVLRGAEQGFGYRKSGFGPEAVILRTRLRLTADEPTAIRARMRTLMEKRKASQPLEKPSAGSAFKRPEAGYAAALIDEAGLKGLSVGGAQVSEKHAGFVVNTGGATAEDVKRLLELVRQRVLAASGILLEPEIRLL